VLDLNSMTDFRQAKVCMQATYLMHFLYRIFKIGTTLSSFPRWHCLLHPRTASVWLILSLLVSAGCQKPSASSSPGKSGPETLSARVVKTTRLVQMPMERAAVVTGTLAALDHAILSAKVPGRLQEILVDLGSRVKKGDLIARIDPQDYQLRLQQAVAALSQGRVRLGLSMTGNDDRVEAENTGVVKQARAVLVEARAARDRSQSLLEQGLIPQSQFDVVEANYQVALSRYQDALEEIRNREAVLAQRRSELDLAQQLFSDCSLTAPFDGAIEQRQATVGEYLAAGSPVVTLVRMDPLRLRAEVPERQAPSIRSGQKVRLSIEGDPAAYQGEIVRLSPVISEQNRMLRVEAEVPNPGTLRPGSFARVSIVVATGQAPALPEGTIVTFAGIEKVVLAQKGKAVERTVTTGRRIPGWVEILSGVSPGDAVVVDPGNLQTGQPVALAAPETSSSAKR
jgi:RND family efflux transporter MFP subunit